MSELLSLEGLAALLALTSLEIVLGIDNIVFLAIITQRLPPASQPLARRLGLILALFMRILLLLGITWVMRLTTPWFTLFSHPISGRDLILLLGGLFLIIKATHEMHAQMEGGGEPEHGGGAPPSFVAAVLQIGLLDIIFSLDSVITAVGMARHLSIMIIAVVLAMIIMIIFSGPVTGFISRHPTMRVLALAFLLLVGVMLVAEGMGKHLDRGYLYFAMAFSLGVELVNMRMRRNLLKGERT